MSALQLPCLLVTALLLLYCQGTTNVHKWGLPLELSVQFCQQLLRAREGQDFELGSVKRGVIMKAIAVGWWWAGSNLLAGDGSVCSLHNLGNSIQPKPRNI